MQNIHVWLTVIAHYELVPDSIPTGSILGQILFLIYVNDSPNSICLLRPITFAENTTMAFTNLNYSIFSNLVTIDLIKMNEWFLANGSLLNSNETQATRFQLNHGTVTDTPLKFSSSAYFLGLTTDDALTWKV